MTTELARTEIEVMPDLPRRLTAQTFGLRDGQMRASSDKYIHNGWWFDKDGRYVGWGDLTVSDFFLICSRLQDDEHVYIVSERTAGNMGIKPHEDRPEKRAEDLASVVADCIVVITPSGVYPKFRCRPQDPPFYIASEHAFWEWNRNR